MCRKKNGRIWVGIGRLVVELDVYGEFWVVKPWLGAVKAVDAWTTS